MRLLELRSGRAQFAASHDDHDVQDYAILSHTWDSDENEVKYHELAEGQGCSKPGYHKIRLCGEQARKDGLQTFWVDTCCIDKRNSSELQEAINSMYRWYANAKLCYVYLQDVVGIDWTAFEKSKWFTRGWTLQELLAPRDVRFYDKHWTLLGDKRSLSTRISNITGIHIDVLLDASRIAEYSIAERMSWAAGRSTKRPEDRAYSLLGIFDINDMPMMYGQGETAFRRLQEKIMENSDDGSLFAWPGLDRFGPGLLATSPDAFSLRGGIKATTEEMGSSMSKQSVSINMRLKGCGRYTFRGLLECVRTTDGAYMSIFLRQIPGTNRYARVSHDGKDFAVIDASVTKLFSLPTQISIYQDVGDLRSKLRGIDYKNVPNLSFRLPTTLLSARYTVKLENKEMLWDSTQRTLTIPAKAVSSSGLIGSFQLAHNDFGVEVVRLGFDEDSHPVCMVAKSHGSKAASGGARTAGFLGAVARNSPFLSVVPHALHAVGADVTPTVHKGKGIWGYTVKDATRSANFWDHDATGTQGSQSRQILEQKDRKGLWLLKGDRSASTALSVLLLEDKDVYNTMPPSRKSQKVPSVEVKIQKSFSSDPFTWDVTMDAGQFPGLALLDIRNSMRPGKGHLTDRRRKAMGAYAMSQGM